MTDWIYALDIGTRKVAGLIGRRTARGAEVVDLEVQEHSERSMLDGQVHDVAAVAAVVRRVTLELERRLGVPIREAAVAAAGRSLKTSIGTASAPLPEGRPVEAQQIQDLERKALESALPASKGDFHCVGYTPVAYRLDNEPMKSLLDQRGQEASVDVLATFLPRQVLDGLLAVCVQAGLKASCITLEPIAALEAVIPPDLRMLNLALVDVGAGTSDIAIVKGGHVLAFAMVPMAGDEVTEALCHHWVLDFQQAEKLKRTLTGPENETVETTDIFGHDVRSTVSDVRRSVQEVIRELSRTVSDRILELNHGTPSAVVLVGGGSATGGLAEQMGVDLNLENRRIGIRRPTQALNLEDRTGRLTEAWGVTPAGILLVAARDRGLKVRRVTINGIVHSLLHPGSGMTLADLLNHASLPDPGGIPARGQDLRFNLNGRPRRIEGTAGRSATYRLGGKLLSPSDPIEEDAELVYEPPVPGLEARLTAGDLRREVPVCSFFLNGMPIETLTRVIVKDRLLGDSEPIPASAEVRVEPRDLLREILEDQGFEIGEEVSRQILVSLNGQPTYLTQKNFRLTVGGREVDFDYRIRQGEVVEFARHVQSQYRVRDVVQPPAEGTSIRLIVNGRPFTLPGEPGRIFMNGQPVGPDEFIIDHATIVTRDGRPAVGLVSHVLAAMEKPQSTRPGQRLVLTVDDHPAGFTTDVREGSRVVIAFE